MNLTSSAINDLVQQRAWRRRLALWLAAVSALALVASVPLNSWDHQLSQAIRLGHMPGDLRKAIELSEAFAHGSGATAILIALLLSTKPPRRDYWMAVAMTATSGIAANLAKALFTRARPYTYDASASAQAGDVTGWEFLGASSFWDARQKSFPSGHTATAWGLAIGLSLLFPRATVVFVVLAALATFQRLYSGAHFPSDAMAGFGIACLMCSLILWANTAYGPKPKGDSPG